MPTVYINLSEQPIAIYITGKLSCWSGRQIAGDYRNQFRLTKREKET